EVGLHRRCNPGEGDSPRVRLSVLSSRVPLTPTLSPQAGRGSKRTAPAVSARTSRRPSPSGSVA
ncbi:MAG: hypothetical protein CFE30_31825, partial [Bradyrhizobium sp. PARBB1]